jgi:hypothetical protein
MKTGPNLLVFTLRYTCFEMIKYKSGFQYFVVGLGMDVLVTVTYLTPTIKLQTIEFC